MMKCPVCRGLQVGRVGSDQYYCSNCYLEFNFSHGQVNLFEVAEDGSLLATERPSGII
jgi:ribosomal protein L37AE/L43A